MQCCAPIWACCHQAVLSVCTINWRWVVKIGRFNSSNGSYCDQCCLVIGLPVEDVAEFMPSFMDELYRGTL
jgi:hypothetical protein